MKKNKILLPMMALTLVFGLAACNKPAEGSKPGSQPAQSSVPAKENIKVTAAGDKKTLAIEETLQLTASVEGVEWASSDAKVATVDQTGKVTAVAAGEVTISASKEGYYKGSIVLTVNRGQALASLHFEQADHFAADGWWGDGEDGATPVYARTEGNASDQQCIAHMDNGDKETLTFTSSAAIKAELVLMMASSSGVENMGSVMAVKFNNAEVSVANKAFEATESNNEFKDFSLGELNIIAGDNVLELSFLASAPYIDDLAIYSKQQATIAIKAAPAKEAIEVASASLNINRGGTAQINVSKPTDKTGITYKSSNEEIVTVSAAGLVTAQALGDANIIIAKAGMLSTRIAVKVSDEPVPGEIRVEAENQAEGFDFEALGFHMYEDGSYIRFGHSGGAYITGYDVTEEVELSYTVTSSKAQDMSLVILAAPHYNMQAGDIFSFATDATIKLNNQNLTVQSSATVLGDGAAMGAKTQNVIIGDVHLNQGDNPFVIQFHGKAPALDCFKFLPKA